MKSSAKNSSYVDRYHYIARYFFFIKRQILFLGVGGEQNLAKILDLHTAGGHEHNYNGMIMLL